VARILAKALNCETGIHAEPCGECAACVSIDEGRFIDLIEVDAASRTKVDDTRELLENVQYSPTSGRYKVYLIDEVHMLSSHSFNALLKTLEEPPPHVKFLLATTDPQKLPVTVLSRCLQFNLKRLPGALIVERMNLICGAEGIEADTAALARIARAATGSVRDALSLLDQALAFGGGALRDADVAEMLGSMDQRHINDLLRCLAAGDAVALMAQIRALQELVPDYESVLDDLATVLQQIAVLQLAGAESLDEDADLEVLGELAAQLSDEMVQLYYQIAITGRRDINLAPDPRVGFEMTLLRMVAFQPAGAAPLVAPRKAVPKTAPASPGAAGAQSSAPAAKTRQPAPAADADWPTIVESLQLKGAARQLADNCALASRTDKQFSLELNRTSEHLLTEQLQKRLISAIRDSFGKNTRVEITVIDGEIETTASREADETAQKLQAAQNSIENDPNVRDLVDMFGAEVEQESIRPVQQRKR
jgi:DNA polymerase-3 subunit gamma/tau